MPPAHSEPYCGLHWFSWPTLVCTHSSVIEALAPSRYSPMPEAHSAEHIGGGGGLGGVEGGGEMGGGGGVGGGGDGAGITVV